VGASVWPGATDAGGASGAAAGRRSRVAERRQVRRSVRAGSRATPRAKEAEAVRITRIEAVPLRFEVPEARRYGSSRGLSPARAVTLVRLFTDEGIEGLGEASGPPELTVHHVDALAEAFLGQDPHDCCGIMQNLLDRQYHFGRQGLHVNGLSAIETACWDVAARAAGVPACQLLGGRVRQEVDCYATTGFYSPDGSHAALAETVAGHVSEGGFRAAKIKMGRDPVDDAARVRAVRRALPDGVLLMADANANYTLDAALAFERLLPDVQLHWFEEPFPPYMRALYARLRQRTGWPVSAGEALAMVEGFRDYIVPGLCDVVQPDVSRCGGLAEALAVARLAAAYGLRCSLHAWGSVVCLAASVQVMAAIPERPHSVYAAAPLLLECDRSLNPLRDELATEPLRPVGGRLPVRGPGLGIELDWDAVARYRLDA
jgi:D-galactarolactone cycloisomerase